jgi:outer membrane biosynthesis protein TonB
VNLEFRARRTPPGRLAGVIGTVVVHAAAAAFMFSQVKAAPPGPPVYAVDLVAAPAPTTKRRIAREAVPTPPPVEKPAPVKPKPTPPPKKPAPPEPKPPPQTEPDREPPPPTSAPMAPAEGETPSTGTDAATIKTPGLAFPFPDYLRNIVNQVYQRWDRSNAGSRSAEISFLILKDGSVRDIRFVTPSGNFAFDLDAQGAIEAAGNSLAFGPLPDGWEADVLPVSLYFKPTR